MKPDAHTTFPVRVGRALGRRWRAGERVDRKARDWLVAKGLGAGLVNGLLWSVKLVVLAVLLYGAFWLALLILFAIAAAWIARNSDLDDEREAEWRTGPSGFGLYRGGIRVDIGDPHEDN